MIVFGQLSVQESEAQRVLPEARVVPPIRRGDLYRHYREGARCFFIVDGEFQQSLAVSPNEILDVMRAGALVFGSSSMGALRAAELEAYGMIGFGRIFEHARDSALFCDDDVGHLYSAETLAVRTLPRIEIDLILGDRRLSAALREYHYTQLDLATLEAFIARRAPRAKQAKYVAALRRAFQDPSARQKHVDAIGLLHLAKAHLTAVRDFNRTLLSP